MLSLLDVSVVVVLLALVLALQIASSTALREIIARLQSDHHVLWLQMGCPSKWYLTLPRGSELLENIGTNRISLVVWLSNKEYVDLNDPVITKMARRRQYLDRLCIAFVVLLSGYGFLKYYGLLSTIGNVV